MLTLIGPLGELSLSSSAGSSAVVEQLMTLAAFLPCQKFEISTKRLTPLSRNVIAIPQSTLSPLSLLPHLPHGRRCARRVRGGRRCVRGGRQPARFARWER